MTTGLSQDVAATQVSLLGELGLGVDSCPNLIESARRSAKAIENAREVISEAGLLGKCDDIVAFGSLARHELTPSSDLDYLLVSESNAAPPIDPRIIAKLRTAMVEGSQLSEPGSTGIFGQSISASALTDNIGLQEDTNVNLTRRVLFLEESTSLANPELHGVFLQRIIGRYLAANKESAQIPRFLLNDVIRYWRTIAIDFQAKAEKNNPKALRYLKLLIPRKLCFVSSLAPLFFLHSNTIKGQDERLAFLAEQYSQPSTVRLLQFLVQLSDNDLVAKRHAVDVIKSLDFFIEKSSLHDWREAVEVEAFAPRPKESKNYGGMRNQGKVLHKALGSLFVDSRMAGFSKEFLVI